MRPLSLYSITFTGYEKPHLLIIHAPSLYVAVGIAQATYPRRPIADVHSYGDTARLIDALDEHAPADTGDVDFTTPRAGDAVPTHYREGDT
jgi:hypothetical protein